jgi:DNA-binding GntR family transcriptional regulator
MLEARGLIVRRRARGAHVAYRSTPDEAQALYLLRVPLESHLAARAAELRSEADLTQLDSIHMQFERTASRAKSAGALNALMSLDSDFHWTIYTAADSDLISIVASYWARLQRELYDRVYGGSHPLRFGSQHGEIIEALRAQEPEAAKAAMRAHIEAGWEVVEASLEAEDADQLGHERT